MQLLDLQWITNAHRAEKVRREIRDAGELQQFAFGKTVTDLHIAVVWQTDDIACVRLLDLLAARRHEGHDARHLDLAIEAQMLEFHAALEAP